MSFKTIRFTIQLYSELLRHFRQSDIFCALELSSTLHITPFSYIFLQIVTTIAGDNVDYVIMWPIFDCDANYLVSRVGVGQCPRRQSFALEIPTCWYILALPNANPLRQSVEYRWRWVPNAKFLHWPCTFLFFGVDFIRIGKTMRNPFPVEYGLNVSYYTTIYVLGHPW